MVGKIACHDESGLIAVFRQRERSWLIYLVALGSLLLALIFITGEFLGPH